MIRFPNAKINLGLNVVERRTDGYHNLETVFYPIPLEDVLEISESGSLTFHQSGAAVAGSPDDNLVMKAYRLLKAEYPSLPPVQIHLHKHIPSGAGLGGGSSDAACMLASLRDKFSLPADDDRLEELASRLGADCAFFVRNRPVFATGIGNVFTPLPSLSLKGYTLVLVKPDIFVSTREAFALIRPHYPEHRLTEIISLPVSEWRSAGLSNDFEASVFAQHPTIGQIKDRLYGLGAQYASMSGSGSSLFALFGKGAQAPDEDTLRRLFPGAFCFVCELEY
ncbi:MAG: 4-(cytidine 5'-diphospho)-2-C-methyl-D-erythritol kinase [Bacteroidaceae bacterium]|nr:4-(cytidine 5'-diphospho)-2-C-methyl-D-erythritol kinase [Bacteroidaceae bacterium]